MDFLSGIMAPISSLIGGIFGQNNASKQAEAAANLAQQNRMDQLTYAQNSIKWRVDDANRAGINPLAALGAPGLSFSNQTFTPTGSNALGDSIAQAGQQLSRAAAAQSPDVLRTAELERKLLEAKIANVNSDTVRNMKAASDQQVTMQPGTPPPIPLPRPNVMRPGFSWDAYNAKPLYEVYADEHGGLVHLPTGNASTAMQNWASMPAQIGVAAGEIGHSIQDMWNAVGSPVFGSVRRGVRSLSSPSWMDEGRNTVGY